MNEYNEILERIELINEDAGKISVTHEQLKKLELLVVGYMLAAQHELEDKELSKAVMSGFDVKWDSLFNISPK